MRVPTLECDHGHCWDLPKGIAQFSVTTRSNRLVSKLLITASAATHSNRTKGEFDLMPCELWPVPGYHTTPYGAARADCSLWP